jgi:hypothetical protein
VPWSPTAPQQPSWDSGVSTGRAVRDHDAPEPAAAALRCPVHRSLWLAASHLGTVDGIPTTRVARTVVDLAGVVPAARTERAVDNCLAMGLITTHGLEGVTAELARPGRPGIALMHRLLDERGDGYVAPASELEARFYALVRSAGLEEPVPQPDVGDDELPIGRSDYGYLLIRLLIELDSRRHHLTKLDFAADRERDNRRVAAGWRPLRFTWHDVTRRPTQVLGVLRASGVRSRYQDDVA